MKFLGIIFDNKLTWKPHIDNKLQKALGVLWLSRRAIGKTYGLSPRSIAWIYTAIVRPMFSYMVALYGGPGFL